MSLPALESLKADYTEIWCAEQNVSLARFADRALSIGSAGLDRLGLLPAEDVVLRLRTFDSIVCWYGTRRPEFRHLVAELGLPFEFRDALPAGEGHAVEFYRGTSHFPVIRCPEVTRSRAVIHPFASSVTKRAPMPCFSRIADQLAQSMPVHWLCGPDEQLAGAVCIPDLYELACWLRGARVLVGNDSGISHLAAAVGTPVLSLFTTTDPRMWSPRGPSSYWIRL